MSICWVHMKRGLLDFASKDRGLRTFWSMRWGCMMHVQKQTSAVQLMEPIQWLARQIVLLAKERFGSERSAPDIFSCDISFLALPATWKIKFPLCCFKVVNSEWRFGITHRSGQLCQVLKTCSFISCCNILRTNCFNKKQMVIPVTHMRVACWPWLGATVLDDIYRILHTVMYCLDEFQSETIEVSWKQHQYNCKLDLYFVVHFLVLPGCCPSCLSIRSKSWEGRDLFSHTAGWLHGSCHLLASVDVNSLTFWVTFSSFCLPHERTNRRGDNSWNLLLVILQRWQFISYCLNKVNWFLLISLLVLSLRICLNIIMSDTWLH